MARRRSGHTAGLFRTCSLGDQTPANCRSRRFMLAAGASVPAQDHRRTRRVRSQPRMERPRSTLPSVLEFVIRPIRSVLGVSEHDVVEAVHEARDIEANMLDAVHAIEHATASIEHNVEVIETLATSVDPLRASVDRLTDTMQQLVAMMAPMGAAEHEAHRIGRFFGGHHHDDRPEGESKS